MAPSSADGTRDALLSSRSTPHAPRSTPPAFSRSHACVGLHHSQDIAFAVFAVDEPANAWNGHLGYDDLGAGCRGFLREVIDVGHVNGTHVCNHRRPINFALPADQSAV